MSKEASWIKQYWRPAIAWQYFAVCLCDFIIFPVATAWYSWKTGIDYAVWQPLTLKESGFYHMAMGAVLGVAAWTRGMEKIRKSTESESSDSEIESDEFSEPPRRKIDHGKGVKKTTEIKKERSTQTPTEMD